jgi:hypothetical protein
MDEWRWPGSGDRASDEAYMELPPLLPSGLPATSEAWQRNRETLLGAFAENVFGYTPSGGSLAELTLCDSGPIFGSLGIVSHWLMTVEGPRGTLDIPLLVIIPSSAPPRGAPMFLGMNITGNLGVGTYPGVRMASWMPVAWPLKLILERGYAIGTLLNDAVEPDAAGAGWCGVRGLFEDFDSLRTQGTNQWGALGAWAWGLSRAREAVASMDGIDGERVIVHGHSRLGMTALWAAAQDEAFGAAVSSQSGLGGASLTRHIQGEDIAFASSHFPWWFCGRYAEYAHQDGRLPVDQHQLLALVAPRPLHVASADRDRHADPQGEFLATLHASPVYELFGRSGTLPNGFRGSDLDVKPVEALRVPWPQLGERTGSTLSYHVREGGHGVTANDWRVYLDFAAANGI